MGDCAICSMAAHALKIREQLGRATEPTFKPVFGAHWESLPTYSTSR